MMPVRIFSATIIGAVWFWGVWVEAPVLFHGLMLVATIIWVGIACIGGEE